MVLIVQVNNIKTFTAESKNTLMSELYDACLSVYTAMKVNSMEKTHFDPCISRKLKDCFG
jgi:hypothetical protein